MNFLEKFNQIVQQIPNKIALAVSVQELGVSYGNLDILSGRVLSYLNKHGIGKEDFVVICLPRGTKPLICAVGVLKAGAAFVIIEENYTPERAAFIRQDCNCKLLIDYAVWQEIQHEQSAPITAPWNDHAAAFAVYTSGSTGVPKGVVHEYGNIESIIASTCDGNMHFIPEDTMALIAPLIFVVSMMSFFGVLFTAGTLYIVPYSVAKNPKEFYMYLIENCISAMFLPPRIFNMFPNFGPHMRVVFLGGERATRAYKEGVQAFNIYGTSESGAVICYFHIDKAYDITPVGAPPTELGIRLLDENGNQVADGEIGEICVHAPFVRGYLNRPKENEITFRKGNIYHTGDLAHKQSDGNYVIRGRVDEMIKINGNRIEPSEIEAVVKKVLDLDWACAKGFIEGDSGFVCVYYTKDIEINYDKTREELMNYLPYYMLPSHFIKLDSVPLNANGKLDLKALMPPVKEAGKGAYFAPTNDLEAQLCKAFEKALQMDNIGIKDDFYMLGGDSLRAMTVFSLCEIEGLTVGEIFRGRTPEKIARLCKELNANATAEEQNALNVKFPLTPEQNYMVDYQLYAPKSTMYNISAFAKLDSQIDADRFAHAVSKTIAQHPALLTVLGFNEDGEMIQYYDSTLAKTIAVECISESELSVLRDTLIRPYKIVEEPLYRCRIFKTEKSLYFFFDVHHTVFDGISFDVMLHDINALYNGETNLQRDCYYELLAKNIRATRSAAYKEGLDYFKNRYDRQSLNMLETYANKNAANHVDSIEILLPKIENIRIMSAPTQQPLSNNMLFLAITAVALSCYCKTPQAEFLWVYNGRSSLTKMHIVGLLFSFLPLSVQLSGNLKFTELLEDVKEQVSLGIQHECVHYIATRLKSTIDNGVCMLCQDGIYDFDTLCGKPFEIIPIKNPYAASQSALDICLFQSENGTALKLEFNSDKFDKLFMEGLMNSFEQIVKKLTSYSDLSEITINDLTHE